MEKSTSAFSNKPDLDTLLLENLSQGSELMVQLKEVLLPILPDEIMPEFVCGIFSESLESLSKAVSLLRSADDQKQMSPVKKRKKSEFKDEDDCKDSGYFERRLPADSWSLVTSTPHIDGHQWRKYGQKWIKGSRFQRSYYRCYYRDDQGCKAVKTVQQIDDHSIPVKFIVTYSTKHTCTPMIDSAPVIVNSSPGKSLVHSMGKNCINNGNEVIQDDGRNLSEGRDLAVYCNDYPLNIDDYMDSLNYIITAGSPGGTSNPNIIA